MRDVNICLYICKNFRKFFVFDSPLFGSNFKPSFSPIPNKSLNFYIVCDYIYVVPLSKVSQIQKKKGIIKEVNGEK